MESKYKLYLKTFLVFSKYFFCNRFLRWEIYSVIKI